MSTKNPHAQALSALGASKGGYARAKSLSPRRRKEIAMKAAKAAGKVHAAKAAARRNGSA